MGKGDKKTRRGKLFIGTYGVRRRKRKGQVFKPQPKAEVIKKETREAAVEPEIKPSKPAGARKEPKARKQENALEENK
jgi:30S ribosomal protein S31